LYCRAGPKIRKGHTRVFWGLDETNYSGIAVVSLGKPCVGINNLEELHEGKDAVRIAAAGNPCYLKIMKYVKKVILIII